MGITITAVRGDRRVSITRDSADSVCAAVRRLVELGWAVKAVRIEPDNVRISEVSR